MQTLGFLPQKRKYKRKSLINSCSLASRGLNSNARIFTLDNVDAVHLVRVVQLYCDPKIENHTTDHRQFGTQTVKRYFNLDLISMLTIHYAVVRFIIPLKKVSFITLIIFAPQDYKSLRLLALWLTKNPHPADFVWPITEHRIITGVDRLNHRRLATEELRGVSNLRSANDYHKYIWMFPVSLREAVEAEFFRQ